MAGGASGTTSTESAIRAPIQNVTLASQGRVSAVFESLLDSLRGAAPMYSLNTTDRLDVDSGAVSIVFISDAGGRSNFNVTYCGV